MNSSPRPIFVSPAAPLSHSLSLGARPDLLPPALVVWGLAGAFRFFQRSFRYEVRWMLGWVFTGGWGSHNSF